MPRRKRSPAKRPPAAPVPARRPRSLPRAVVVGSMALLLIAVTVWCWMPTDRSVPPAPPRAHAAAVASAPSPPPAAAQFVGTSACVACHEEAAREWRASDHAHAMLEPSDEALRGDFSGVTLRTGEHETRFFRRDGKPFVRTEGADGKPADFAIRYTFGWYPLQQYLVDLGRGRLQALPVAWDARPASEGGQRWFHLYASAPPPPGDSLHWTGRDQNWNFMCASCHSTNLEKRYDAAADRFDTRWSDINVGCEACHGPGSAHIAWAQGSGAQRAGPNGLRVPPPAAGRWEFATPGAGIAHWSGGDRRAAMEPCFACHSRRREIANPLRADVPLLDQTVPSLLEPGLYTADGQIEDEVFEYGSFLHSRMYRAGVICQDCHRPHSGTLRERGNALCAQCHAPASFDTPVHHHHPAGGPGSQCVDCHMSGKTYMGVDFRRDHSFRVPRPDQGQRLGTPDACTGCHRDQAPDWAAARVRDWVGAAARADAPVAEALTASRQHRLDGAPALLALLEHPAGSVIARATAVAALADYPGPPSREQVRRAAHDAEPLLRLAALRALRVLPEDEQIRLLAGLLGDTTRAVRDEAARIAVAIPAERLDANARERREVAVAELVASETIHLDRPEAHLNLALIDLARGRFGDAETALKRALAMDAGFVPARVNLADLYRATGRDPEAGPLLEEGLRRTPDSPDLSHTLGLLRVRQGERAAALELLAAAAQAAPDNPRYAYVHAVALADSGRVAEAAAVARAALARTPNDAALAQLLDSLPPRPAP